MGEGGAVTAGVQIRPFLPGDEVGINNGFNEVFETNRTLEEWHWKFGDDGGLGRMLVALVAGEIVAHFGLLVVPLWWRGRRLLLGQTVDCYAKRRQGVVQSRVFEQLFQAVREHFGAELDGLFGFPGQRHMKLGQLRLGYAPARPVVVWSRAPRPRSVPSVLQPSPWPPADRIDHLWQAARGRLGASFERDAAQLRRRFSSRPGVEYLPVVAARWWGRPEALAVARLQGGAEQTLLVTDLLWDGRRERGLAELDRLLDAEAHAQGATQIEMWLGGDPLAEALLASRGWRSERHPLGLGATAVSFREHFDAADLLGQLYITMADADLV